MDMNPWWIATAVLLFCSVCLAQEERPVEIVDAAREVSFDRDILPIFRKNCLACHSESDTEGELILETANTALAGGDSGPAVVPGNPDESLLFQLASHQTDPVMPPVDNDVGAKPLGPKQLGLIKLWIQQGAKIGSEAQREEIQWQPVPSSLAPVHAIDVSPDGRWLAAGRGNEVVVYALPAKREAFRLVDASIQETHPDAAHLDIVQSVAFSPDQKTLVTGGFRCVKVWRRDEDGPQTLLTELSPEFLPPDLPLEDLIDFHVSEDQSRLLLVCTHDGNVVAQLRQLPDHKVLKEWTADVFVQDQLAELERNVGLRKERVRVAKADVQAAKKRKTDDENHVKKTEGELTKAKEDVPKRKETFDKAAEAAAQKQQEVGAAESKVEAAKQALMKLVEQLEGKRDGDDKNELRAMKEQAEKQLKDAETGLANKKKELEKAQQQEKKKKQEFEGAEKVVVLSTDAKSRAEKMVQRRSQELTDAEQEAAGFEQLLKSAEAGLSEGKNELPTKLSSFSRARFLDGGWEFAVWDEHGRVARFASEDGALLGVDESGVSGAWKLVSTLGAPSDNDLFADRVTALDFSDDGSMLATGGGAPSRSGEVLLWNVEDWSLVAKVEDVHSDVVYDLVFSPQNDTLASCASDRMVKLIDTIEHKPLKTFEGHTGHVLGVAWRADGRTLVTAGADKVVKVWDAKEGTQKKTISGFKSEVTDVCYLGLEDRFVFCVGTGQVESRDSNGGGKPAFGGFQDYVHRVSSSQNGLVIAAAGEDQVIRVWDPQGKVIAEFK